MAEGVATRRPSSACRRRLGVVMPICETVDSGARGSAHGPRKRSSMLMRREPRASWTACPRSPVISMANRGAHRTFCGRVPRLATLAAPRRRGPRRRPVGLAVEQMVVLVDEEALRRGDQVEAVVPQPPGDAPRRPAGEDRRPVDARVEGGGRRVGLSAELVEQLAQARSQGVGLEDQVVGRPLDRSRRGLRDRRPGRPCTCVGAPTTTRSAPSVRSAVVVAADTTSVANTSRSPSATWSAITWVLPYMDSKMTSAVGAGPVDRSSQLLVGAARRPCMHNGTGPVEWSALLARTAERYHPHGAIVCRSLAPR